MTGAVRADETRVRDPDGAPPPHFAAAASWTGLDGRELDERELLGQVTVVNFWATWCVPCVEEMDLLKRLHPRLAGDGVRLIGVAADAPEESDVVRRFVAKREIEFEIFLGATTDQMEAMGLEPVLPGTVVLDAEGRIRASYSRVIEEDDLERALAGIAADPPPEPDQPPAKIARARPAQKGRDQEAVSRVPS